MSDNIAWLIKDINKLDGHRRNMMEELKVLRDITQFYNERHPELHDKEDNTLNPTRQHSSSLEKPKKQDKTSKKNI